MRPITLPPTPVGTDPEARFQRVRACLQEIERASQEDPAQIFDGYGADATATVMRQVHITSQTAANLPPSSPPSSPTSAPASSSGRSRREEGANSE